MIRGWLEYDDVKGSYDWEVNTMLFKVVTS